MSRWRPSGGAAPDAGPGRGTEAIDRHVDELDGGPAEHRYQPRAPHRFQGRGPLEEVTVHRLADPPSWHLVTYGLSELREKESPDPDLSGWGFELTFRLAGSGDPPRWAVDLMTNLAAYVWSSGHPFGPGHHVDLRGPIRLGTASAITAAMVVPDPVLEVLDGPFGRVEFLQVVGLTADELELCRSWSTDGVADLLARDNPLLVTDLDRTSVADDPRWRGEIEDRSGSDGSSLHELRVASLVLRRRPGRGFLAQMGAGAAAALGPALRRELVAEEAGFSVIGDSSSLRFVVSAESGWSMDDGELHVAVPLAEVAAVAGLFDGRTGWGRVPALPGLRFRVVP
jgi:suppressor of fused